MLKVKKSDIIFPQPGEYRKIQKQAIAKVKQSVDRIFIIRGDGRLEMYFGTEHNKQGFAKVTYDPGHNRKRPGIPQWEFDHEL